VEKEIFTEDIPFPAFCRGNNIPHALSHGA
jgi:hypothetical protein